MSQIKETIKQLQTQRDQTAKELAGLDAAITALQSLSGEAPVKAEKAGKRGGMSAAGRARIAAAQKARWAKIKVGKKVAPPKAAKKRKMSAAGRANIRAAAKARWAKLKAEKQAK